MTNIKELLAEKLLTLSDSISVEEKEEAIETLNISRSTLLRYLSGDKEKIAKVDKATELIQFFSGKIKNRIEKIREANLV